jgi:hypothetical protein
MEILFGVVMWWLWACFAGHQDIRVDVLMQACWTQRIASSIGERERERERAFCYCFLVCELTAVPWSIISQIIVDICLCTTTLDWPAGWVCTDMLICCYGSVVKLLMMDKPPSFVLHQVFFLIHAFLLALVWIECGGTDWIMHSQVRLKFMLQQLAGTRFVFTDVHRQSCFGINTNKVFGPLFCLNVYQFLWWSQQPISIEIWVHSRKWCRHVLVVQLRMKNQTCSHVFFQFSDVVLFKVFMMGQQ